MDNSPPRQERRGYTVVSHTSQSQKDDWFLFCFKLNGRRFEVTVSISKFENSPARTAQAIAALQGIRDPNDGREEDHETRIANVRKANNACYEFIVEPYLGLFESLAPLPAPGTVLTLEHFYSSELFECEITAVDDKFKLGNMKASMRSYQESQGRDETEWITTFPKFLPSQVKVTCGEWKDSFDFLNVNCRMTTVDGQELFFKPLRYPDDAARKHELETYEKIKKADFGPEVRTSRLYGVVVNERQQLRGLLLHRIAVDLTLDFMLKIRKDTTEESLKRWTEQVDTTVKALGREGIVWGDAKPSNILVDLDGDAHVVDFGGGYSMGWVDPEKAETVEGDAEALEKIQEFIVSGGTAKPSGDLRFGFVYYPHRPKPRSTEE